MRKILINKFKNLKNYLYGKQPFNKYYLKLNSNENSYQISLKTLKNSIKEIFFFKNIFKYYPDSKLSNIIKIITIYYNINFKELFIANGSDDILNYIFITLSNLNKKKININDLTYSFYECYIKLYNLKYNINKTNKYFIINIKKYKNNTHNILLTNPNSPTSKTINIMKIKEFIIKNLSSFIILDETYIDYNNILNIKLIKKYNNIIITQTISKSRSGASIRIGLLLSNKSFIFNIFKIKNNINTYHINKISQIITKNIFKDILCFEKNKKKITENKIKIGCELSKNNIKFINSKTNFYIIKIKKNNILLLKKLKKNKIIVRNFEIPIIENFLRITIGNINEYKKLIKIFKNFY